MSEFIFSLRDVGKVTPRGKKILEGIHLSFIYGAKIGVLGLNGSGKSTLLRIIAGEEKEYLGEVTHEKNIDVGYLPQEPQLDPDKTVRENIELGVAATRKLLTDFDAVNMRFGEELTDDEMNALLEEQGRLQDAIDAANAWELDHEIEQAMDALRVPDGDADVTKLSGGERRRVALCRLVLSRPDVLLLDEPTNHLDVDSVAWLEHYLREYKGTVVAVTHDRYFLDNVAEWILELDRGTGIPYKGNYSSWLEQKQERMALEGRQEANKQKVMARELEWVRSSQKARQAKGKARLNAYEDLLKEDKANERIQAGTIFIPPGERLGDVVIDAKGLSKGFEEKLLFENLNFRIPPGATVGVIGGNGVGKTTLCRIMTGSETPDQGELTVGDTVQLGYVDQSRDALADARTVWEEISEEAEVIQLGKREVNSRAYCSWFNFKGENQQMKVGELSGGERNRVHMAKLVKSGANVLILDEPTNDLDVDTLRSLEEAIEAFGGVSIVISHDRWFLDRIATHILAFEGDSHVEWFEGNFTDYEADRKKRLGEEAQPRRVKFRRLAGM